MTVRSQVDRLRWSVGSPQSSGELDLVVAVPVGSGTADHLPPGVHLNADGRVATVVFEGARPGPAVLEELVARLTLHGLRVLSQVG
ncbi:hypothetical protein J0H58_10115 [bacterium]|nr:hypothetical protein [bacterium]